MAIFRIDRYNNVRPVNIPKEKEDYFLSQKFYDVTYVKVDNPPKSDFGFYKYNPDTQQIEVDVEKELELWKKKKKEEIKQAFLDTLSRGFTTSSGITLDSKLEDLHNFRASLDYAKVKNLEEVVIRDYYNQVHTVSVSEFEKMVLELGEHILNCFKKKWDLQARVDQAQDVDEVKTITWYSDEQK